MKPSPTSARRAVGFLVAVLLPAAAALAADSAGGASPGVLVNAPAALPDAATAASRYKLALWRRDQVLSGQCHPVAIDVAADEFRLLAASLRRRAAGLSHHAHSARAEHLLLYADWYQRQADAIARVAAAERAYCARTPPETDAQRFIARQLARARHEAYRQLMDIVLERTDLLI